MFQVGNQSVLIFGAKQNLDKFEAFVYINRLLIKNQLK